MKYNFSQLATILSPLENKVNQDCEVEQLSIDSRKITQPSAALFFALEGVQHNGHHFIAPAYEQGVRCFVIEDGRFMANLPDANYVVVPSVLEALQAIAAHRRSTFNGKVIAITGSNGKTTVKEWLYQLLYHHHKVIRSPRSYNSQVGVPLSIWELTNDYEIAIVEAGISEPQEMKALANMIQPDVGLMVNIGTAHSNGFSSKRSKVVEKLALLRKANTAIYPIDYPVVADEIERLSLSASTSFSSTIKASKALADIQLEKIEENGTGAALTVKIKHRSYQFKLPFASSAAYENALACVAVLSNISSDITPYLPFFEELESPAMRLELKPALNRSTLVYDCYNSDFTALKIALEFVQRQPHSKRTLILSDILQSGLEEEVLYGRVAQLLVDFKINRLIGVGVKMLQYALCFTEVEGLKCQFYESTDRLKQHVNSIPFQDEVILLKGARSFQFEQIGHLLEAKRHATRLEINLTALANNLKVFRSQLALGVRLMAMVKAFGYGAGSLEVARLLQFHRVDYLGVAYADEGVLLRSNGITLPIMVMNPTVEDAEQVLKHQLEPQIYSVRRFEEWKVFMATQPTAEDRQLKVHLKLETGMHRLGLCPNDFNTVVDQINSIPNIQLVGAMTHLAESDNSADKDFTIQQGTVFEATTKTLPKAVLRHAANTGAISQHPNLHFNMVRLGIGMYGIDPSGRLGNQLEEVVSFKSTIAQIKTLEDGDSLGYNRGYKATKPTTIAIVGVGYADGLSRLLGNGNGFVKVKGKRCTLLGNVCMDMIMVDITDVRDAAEGDEVVIFDDIESLTALSKNARTIPYEILSSISERVKRIYFED